jgi:predicted MPP superfamily phosphohydrolase
MIASETIQAVNALSPDMVIISGDFTQIASTEEFKQSQEFLSKLSAPVFSVPGNHDVPPRNLIERFLAPYKKYKSYIHHDLCPVFENDQIILAGLNSARRMLFHWNWANGAISKKQLERLNGVFGLVSDQHIQQYNTAPKWKICTFHHPIQKVEDLPLDVTVFGAKHAIKKLHDMRVDLVLTGHVHHASISERGDENHQCVYLSASTAMSSRLRVQQNGFNVIDLEGDKMSIDIYLRDSEGFIKVQSYSKRRI